MELLSTTKTLRPPAHKAALTLAVLLLLAFLVDPLISRSHAKPYVIGPSDVITLSIYAGGEKQYEASLTVSEDGTLNVPFLGVIKAKGLTPALLAKQLQTPLAADYFVNPKVNIQIDEYHGLKYHIFGAVQNPGFYELSVETTLLGLIAKAGGVSPGYGDFAFLMQNTGVMPTADPADVEKMATGEGGVEPTKIDLVALLEKGDTRSNLVLRSGDMIYIPFATESDVSKTTIYVEGAVRNPGAFDYQQGMTALNACIMAGGFVQFAAPNRTRIIREVDDKVETIKVNLKKVKAGLIADIDLQPGDRIHVPESWL